MGGSGVVCASQWTLPEPSGVPAWYPCEGLAWPPPYAASPEPPLQPMNEQQGQAGAGDRQQQAQQDELPEPGFQVAGEDAEVHAEVANQERQRQEDRRDDGKRADDLRLPTGDEFRVVAQSVLRLLTDVSDVLPHAGDAPAVPVEMLLRAGAHARQLVHRLGDLFQVVGIPPELLDAVGDSAEDLDELVVYLRRSTTEHAQLNLAQPVIEREQLRPEAADQDVEDQEQDPRPVCSGVLVVQGVVLVAGVLQRRAGSGVHGEQEPFGQHGSDVVRLQPPRRRIGIRRPRQHGPDGVRGRSERGPRTGGLEAGGGACGELEALAELGQLIVARVFQVEPEELARLQVARDLAGGRGPIAPGGVHQPDDRRCGRIVPRGRCGLWHFHRSACFLTSHACPVWRAVWVDSLAIDWPRNTCPLRWSAGVRRGHGRRWYGQCGRWPSLPAPSWTLMLAFRAVTAHRPEVVKGDGWPPAIPPSGRWPPAPARSAWQSRTDGRTERRVGVCHGRSIRRPPGGDRGGVRRVAIGGGGGPVWSYPGRAMPLLAWRSEVVMSADIGV